MEQTHPLSFEKKEIKKVGTDTCPVPEI